MAEDNILDAVKILEKYGKILPLAEYKEICIFLRAADLDVETGLTLYFLYNGSFNRTKPQVRFYAAAYGDPVDEFLADLKKYLKIFENIKWKHCARRILVCTIPEEERLKYSKLMINYWRLQSVPV